MIRLRSALLGVLGTVLLGAGAYAALQQRQAFPHLQHERLFPVCEGCHAGIATGNAQTSFPAAADCARCHDGERVVRVNWTGRTPRESNLSFSHPAHYQLTTSAGDAISCQSCHAAGAPTTRMNVGGPQPVLCIQCHAHAAETHPAPEATCSTCHLPLAQTPFDAQRIAAFPRPAWHDAPDFISAHGRASEPLSASCAVCHARETCERCHANAERQPRIMALPRDARVAQLEEGKAPMYIAPASHEDPDWRRAHAGAAMTENLSCSNCHTQASCRACHTSGEGVALTAIAALPPSVHDGVRATGVSVQEINANIHPADIVSNHRTLAASGALTCTACHTSQTCAGCHQASDSRRFHQENFVQRHATDVFSNGADCQSCHSTETFCRDCHTRTGVAASTGMNAAFHTGLPNWVLSHGQAARRGIESCASCHRQSDCVRCHSAVGGWRVNPHGSSFPANRTAIRNAASCRWCHL